MKPKASLDDFDAAIRKVVLREYKRLRPQYKHHKLGKARFARRAADAAYWGIIEPGK